MYALYSRDKYEAMVQKGGGGSLIISHSLSRYESWPSNELLKKCIPHVLSSRILLPPYCNSIINSQSILQNAVMLFSAKVPPI